METWDISTAFLQGLRYEELKKHAKALGIEIKENREVYLAPPPNVWRHFREYKNSTINIADTMICFFVLQLLKPIYGTVDAPLLWQLALCIFIIQDLKGIQSVFDDSFFTWSDANNNLIMIWTVHVDDIIVLATKLYHQWALQRMETRFGKIKRHALPFTHMGMTYELLGPRHLFIHQDAYLSTLSKIPINKSRPLEADATAQETTEFRSLLCSLLWLCQTREDIYTETVQLQQATKTAKIQHLKQTNSLLDRAIRNRQQAGLHFPPLEGPLRLVSIADASHGNKMTSYPQEGMATLLMEDTLDLLKTDKKGNIDPKTMYLLGGKAHPLVISSSKSKRISHSTCHAETNSGYRSNLNTQFTALRFTEIIMAKSKQPKAVDMMHVFENNLLEIRSDHVTDCFDFWQLCCGEKGIPSDKSSRLAVLSMREERLSGRIRGFIHCPTDYMLVDGLTKVAIFPVLMRHLTTGYWDTDVTKSTKGKTGTLRIMAPQKDFDEQDLVDLRS